MRRFLFWILPLTVSTLAAASFAYGFYLALRGNAGQVVNAPTAPIRSVPAGEIRTLILGDSVGRGTGDESGLGIGGAIEAELDRRKVRHLETVNVSINGARTADLLRQMESRSIQTLIAESSVIVISIGGNDLYGDPQVRAGGAPPDPAAAMTRVISNIRSVVAGVRRVNPSSRVFLVGLYNPFGGTPFGKAVDPIVRQWTARLIEEFRSDPNFTVVQTYDLFAFRDRLSADRFHPGAEGYRLIGRRIADAL